MSIDIVIKQKGIIKKKLPLSVIIGKQLHYGEFDGMRLNPGKLGDREFIAYNPEHIGRGLSIIWNPKERNSIVLRSLTPTNPQEIEDFFNVIKRITDYWKCNIEVDGNVERSKEFLARLQDMQDFNVQVLKGIFQRIISEEGSSVLLECTMWPLAVGKEEAQLFIDKPETFFKWMHEKQVIDAYYAKPQFYKKDDEIIGRYVLTEGARSIFPNQPSVPSNVVDPETNRQLECNNYEVLFYSSTQEKLIGSISFDHFIGFIKDKSERFDAHNILFEGLSLKDIESLIEH